MSKLVKNKLQKTSNSQKCYTVNMLMLSSQRSQEYTIVEKTCEMIVCVSKKLLEAIYYQTYTLVG